MVRESDHIVTAAAKLLKAAIRETQYDMKVYSSWTNLGDSDKSRKWNPALLNTFLDNNVCSNVNKVALGHSIAQAVRPKTVIA